MSVQDPYAQQWASTDSIGEAIKRLPTDAGAVFEKPIRDELRQMRNDDPARFARLRQQVKETKTVSMAEFDRLTTLPPEASETSKGMLFEEVAPWPCEVDGAALLDDLTSAIGRYVVADKETLRAAALWSTFTWLIDVVQIAPIANITAPERRCGKSQLLTVFRMLCYRPMQVSNIAPAALFRSIELWSPTLLIDEVDSFLAMYEEARGIINAGFTRDSATVIRCVGENYTPTPFTVWGAKALCGIGKIADTLADRSIPLRLRRRLRGEKVERMRHSDPEMWMCLRARLARFAQDNSTSIERARFELIEGLNDRANDSWEPLLAIADAAGGEWPRYARSAAIALHGTEDDSPSIGVQLLADIQVVFQNKKASRLFSEQLLEALTEDNEAPWATWNRGKPMSARQLSGKLAGFGIKSGTRRLNGIVKKGYERDDFLEAWERYLSPSTPAVSVTALQAT